MYAENEQLEREIELSEPQTKLFLTESPFPLFCAGFGSGKSLTMGLKILDDLDIADGVKIGAYAPTYDLLKMITIPYLEELLYDAGEPYKLNKSDYFFQLSRGRRIYCRSMDNPARIVGYEVLRSHVDELDILKAEQAEIAWNKILGRNRQKIVVDGQIVKNRVNAYSTPEGFNFCYNRWVKNPADGYEIIKASTYSNQHNLPPDYIPNLIASYPPQLIEAYLDGEFVNLTSGAVYPRFDRVLNHCDDVVEKGDHLHIGMDFNVNNMAAGIHVIRNNEPRAVDEITGGRDTPDVCQIISERYPDHQITIYPDASGNGTSSKSASKSDISIIKSFGFKVKAPNKNPFVKDRVASLNAAICDGNGYRKYKVNTIMCPSITESLEQQVWNKQGEPDKTAGNDHHCDEVGYFVNYNWPIVQKRAELKSMSMHVRR